MKLAESGQPIHADWVSLKLYAELSGYSVATIRGFIKTHWTNGIEYVNRGRIAVNVANADRWSLARDGVVEAVSKETALYRHWYNDTLLYVGVSVNPFSRTKQHLHNAKWFYKTEYISIEWLPSREEALAAEKSAIKKEKPLYNVVYNQ